MQTLIIAEAGVNHNGDMEMAKALVDVAADAGADIVKFQSFKANRLASKIAEKADYQKETTGKNESQLEMLKKLELSYDDHLTIIEHCKKRSIRFLSTPFDTESVDLLVGLGITIGKIPSGEITNLPYLQKMAHSFPELIISTGMCDMKDIGDALHVLTEEGLSKEKITVLHCNTEYPTPFGDVNLHAMQSIANAFQVKVGYSDHTKGIEVPVAAVALGASVIEKHFTLDRTMEGPDHKASLEPGELKSMILSIRNIEQALGNGIKIPSASEIKNKEIARKSVVAARDLQAGHVITENDITAKRPGTGISPMRIPGLLGRTLTKTVGEDELLTEDHFK